MTNGLIFEKIVALCTDKSPNDLKVLELGSGTCLPILPELKKYPGMRYCGVEPSKKDFDFATQLLKDFKNVQLINSFATDLPFKGEFDICFSQSVLEHVKYLEEFLKTSIDAVRAGGYIVHSFDLGHALHPSSVKERFQVFLGNYFPMVLPAHKFVRYVDQDEINSRLQRMGVHVLNITYHGLFDYGSLRNGSSGIPLDEGSIRHIAECDFVLTPVIRNWPRQRREKLFSTICIWGRKD